MNKMRMGALIIAALAGTAGYATAQDYRYGDRDDYRYSDRDDYRYSDRDNYRYDNRHYGFQRGRHVAREFGFRDGAQVAREDAWRGKPYNPYPRGRYDDADHGYRREFGNRHEYRERYTEAYRQGYESQSRDQRYYR